MLNEIVKNKKVLTVIAVAWVVSIGLSIYANSIKIKEYKQRQKCSE